VVPLADAVGLDSIATTTAIPASTLDAIRAAAVRRKGILPGEKDEFPLALARHGHALELFEHPGQLLGTVVAYLAERRGVDLRRSRHGESAAAISTARGSTFLILDEEHVALGGKLSDAGVTAEELVAFHDAFTGTRGGREVAEEMREGIRFLRRALESVSPGAVVLLAIL
jgi:hypothetical protein